MPWASARSSSSASSKPALRDASRRLSPLPSSARPCASSRWIRRATSVCCRPSCRSRSIFLRSDEDAVTSRCCDARSACTESTRCSWSRRFSTASIAAAGAAAMLAVENRRLQEHLVDSVQALRASQQRLVSASSSERRKIERDLHDGLQQTLVALRIHLELAQGLAEEGSGLSRRLASLSAGFDEALEELRALAHGIYPPLLSEEGLAAALREAARRSTVPLSIGVEDVGRLSEECETADYCCLEALQNVAKHAGDEAVAELRLWQDGRAVCFSVVDDGVGFVPNPGRD